VVAGLSDSSVRTCVVPFSNAVGSAAIVDRADETVAASEKSNAATYLGKCNLLPQRFDSTTPKDLSPAPSWREIAEKASEETDPKKLSELVAQLCAKLEEEQREKKAFTPPLLPKRDRHPPNEPA
jgi:hypothetical protein